VVALLVLLVALHQLGLVHRDIRRDNIIWHSGRWYLIDWEVAGIAGTHLEFAIRRVPPDVGARHRVYTCQDDLWQVGGYLSAAGERLD
jgi:aminoglycoside phosphotransferase (APT) family kinase protein